MSETTEMVTVRVQLSGRWEYCQDVQMTRAEYVRLDVALDEGGRAYKRAVSDISGLYVDPRDVELEDADNLDDFRIVEQSGA